MTTFRVLGGQYKYNGKIYKKGETFTSHLDLDQTFPHHFVRVEAPTTPTENVAKPARHKAHRGRAVPRQEPTQSKASTGVTVPPVDADSDGPGMDVTVKFPKAKDASLVVYRKASKFFVHEADDPTPLNTEGLERGEVDAFIERMTP